MRSWLSFRGLKLVLDFLGIIFVSYDFHEFWVNEILNLCFDGSIEYSKITYMVCVYGVLNESQGFFQCVEYGLIFSGVELCTLHVSDWPSTSIKAKLWWVSLCEPRLTLAMID